jgi:hypothetical protein
MLTDNEKTLINQIIHKMNEDELYIMLTNLTDLQLKIIDHLSVSILKIRYLIECSNTGVQRCE